MTNRCFTRFKDSRATYTTLHHMRLRLILAQLLQAVAILVYKYENRLAGFAAQEIDAVLPIPF